MVKRFGKKEGAELGEAYNKVLNWFFDFPDREMSLNDLSDQLEISKTTANRIVSQLKDENFLNVEILGKVWRITCNKFHLYNFTRKIPTHLIGIYESGIIEEIHKIIPNPKAVILFGSYRKGDDGERSDIDIAVEVFGNEEIKIETLGVLNQLGYRKNILVNLHIFSRNKVDINLFSNIANGIVLEGFLEVRP